MIYCGTERYMQQHACLIYKSHYILCVSHFRRFKVILAINLMTMNSINFAIQSKQGLILLTLLSCICLFYCELTAANINKAGYLEIKQTQC